MQFKNITEVNANTIKVLIEKSATEHEKIRNLYERYKQTTKGVPIFTRTYKIDGVEQTDKINNKIAVDMFGECINFKIGFFCGNAISYILDKTDYQQERNIISKTIDKVKSVFVNQEPKKEIVLSSKYDEHLEVINNFNKLNSMPDMDMETAKRSAACGYCGRLIYSEEVDGVLAERIKLIEPWECIFIGDSIENPDATIRYYDVVTYDTMGKEDKQSYAELYTPTQVDYYVKNTEGAYILDAKKSSKSYFWGKVPLIGFANNDEFLDDIGPSGLSIIDAKNRVMSDVNSETEQTRLAYMKFKNCSITKEQMKEARQTGAFSLPGEGSDVDFIIKNINDTAIENHLNRLENDFYRTTGFPNMNDASFGGTITGVALKNKFRPFEDKCKRSELKFKKSFQSQYTKLCKVWADRGIVIDPMSIDFIFTRNYPQNLVEEIQILRDSKGIISEETRFSLVSFITDPEKEIERLKAEETENLDNFIAKNEALQANAEKNNPDKNNVDKNIPDDKTRQAISNEVKK